MTIMGKNQNTFSVTYNGVTYIQFFANELIETVQNSFGPMEMEVVGVPQVNHWNGRTIPQISIKEYEIKSINTKEF